MYLKKVSKSSILIADICSHWNSRRAFLIKNDSQQNNQMHLMNCSPKVQFIAIQKVQPTTGNECNLSACILWIQLPYISTELVNSKTRKITRLIAKVNLTYTTRHNESDSLPGSSGKHILIYAYFDFCYKIHFVQ